MTYARRYLLSSSNSTSTTVSQVKSTAADPPEAVAAAESDFVVILAALLCALICGVGLLAVARCAWLRRGAGGIRRGGFPSANKGLKKKVLQSLPKYTYDSASAAENGKATSSPGAAADCAICLSEYVDGDEIRVLPQCGHGFHVQCIDTWLGSHSSCPSCRQILAVPRCRKCGEFPAVGSGNPSAGGGGPGAGGEGQTEVKSRHDSSAAASTSSTFLP